MKYILFGKIYTENAVCVSQHLRNAFLLYGCCVLIFGVMRFAEALRSTPLTECEPQQSLYYQYVLRSVFCRNPFGALPCSAKVRSVINFLLFRNAAQLGVRYAAERFASWDIIMHFAASKSQHSLYLRRVLQNVSCVLQNGFTDALHKVQCVMRIAKCRTVMEQYAFCG